MNMTAIGGLLLLAGAATLLGACQEPVSSRTGDRSSFQNTTMSDDDSGQQRRRCCRRAARGSKN